MKDKQSMQQKLYMNWSSGKDSAFALYRLQRESRFIIDQLFTTINGVNQRVSMHGLHRRLLVAQAAVIGIPLDILELPELSDMETYNRFMKDKVQSFKAKGYLNSAFGDIFLEDLRQYREEQLSQEGIKAHFPLWQSNTKELIYEFLELGFKSIIVAANAKWFDQGFVGQVITKKLLKNLPKEVDPCGENGEFHTFCFDGPIFKKPVDFKIGEKVLKAYPNPSEGEKEVSFWFCDLRE